MNIKINEQGVLDIYQIWSYIRIDEAWGDNRNTVAGNRVSFIRQYRINLNNLQFDNIIWQDGYYSEVHEYTRGNDRQELINARPDLYRYADFIRDQQPVWSHEARPHRSTIEYNGGVYSLLGSALIFTGSPNVNSVTLDLIDTKIVDILKDICKLRNSIFFIDSEKNLHVVSRDFYQTQHTLECNSISSTPGKFNRKGEISPKIDTKLIKNRNLETFIRNRYTNTIFLQEYESYKGLFPDVNEMFLVNLIDAIEPVSIGMSAGNPFVVHRREIRIGEVKIHAVRAI